MTHEEIEALIRQNWGRTIRSRRQAMEMSQDEFRYLFDGTVSQSTVQRWEAGEAEPRIKHRLEMARIFGIPAAVLFPLIDQLAA